MPRDLKKLAKQLKRQKGIQGISSPANFEVSYYRALLSYTKAVGQVFEDTVGKALERLERASDSVQDSATIDLASAWNSFDKRIRGLKKKDLAIGVYKKTLNGVDKFQRKKFVANVNKALGVDIKTALGTGNVNEVVRRGIDDNIKLIKSIGDSYKARAADIISNGLTSGSSFTSIRKSLLELGGFKDQFEGTETRRAKTIARDQMQKLVASLNEARQLDAGVTHYYWDTAGDERVRPDHKDNDGDRFAWNKPPSKTGHPGHDVNCRCVAKPDISSALGESNDITEAVTGGEEEPVIKSAGRAAGKTTSELRKELEAKRKSNEALRKKVEETEKRNALNKKELEKLQVGITKKKKEEAANKKKIDELEKEIRKVKNETKKIDKKLAREDEREDR